HPGFEGKENPFRERAAYQRVLIVSDMDKSGAIPVDQVLATYDDYIALNPKGERVPQLLYKQGEILFNRKDFRRSAAAFDRLVRRYPRDERVKDARLMSSQALFEAGEYDEVERRSRYNLLHLALADAERAKQQELLSLASFKQAESLQAEGRGVAAADRFADLYAEFPGQTIGPHALYSAALAYRDAGRVSESLAALEKILRAHPDSEYAFDAALLSIARHEEDENWGAVEDKLDLARKLRPQAPEVREIAWRLAEGVNAKGGAREAARLYRSYARLYPQDADRVAAGKLRVFAAEYEALPADAPEARLREMLARFDAIQREGGGKAKIDDYHRAALLFRLAERRLAEYEAVRFDKNAEANLARKTKLLDGLTKEYLAIADLGFKDFRAAVGYKLGLLYEDFHDALVGAPAPAELTAPEEVEMYRKLIAEKAAPYKKEAVAAYETLVKQAGESETYDKWIARAQVKLAILAPLEHQPLEMEIVMPGPEMRFFETQAEPDPLREVSTADRLF
ncbi:MAG: tetratricopeptide repeat protein, partial [Candidatus Methylomirabilis sp.]|nr:tetratricopeptide repeat protein [Deltaproteobacteria bacterium]